MATDAVKRVSCTEIDSNSEDLYHLSRSIWENPELDYNEKHAHKVLTTFLEKHGFDVERSYKLDTAFRAVYGQGETGPNVAILCEYDALPEIGHACGHNLIAEVGVAAGLGVKAALKVSGIQGKVTIHGTPDEEGLRGKIDLINANAFDNVDVAMMAHPDFFATAAPVFLAITTLNIKFHGKASHAAGFPWDGINALDAAVLCYQNISCMRQQMKPDWRVHGIIVNGGTNPNIIPELTELEYYIWAPTDAELKVLMGNVSKCIEAAALATGCRVNYEYDPRAVSSLLTNNTLAGLYGINAKSLGMVFTPEAELAELRATASTDMGNVSHTVPSIHAEYYIGVEGCKCHTREFTVASGSRQAQPYTLEVSKALAMTALDVLSSSEILSEIKADFEADMNKA